MVHRCVTQKLIIHSSKGEMLDALKKNIEKHINLMLKQDINTLSYYVGCNL